MESKNFSLDELHQELLDNEKEYRSIQLKMEDAFNDLDLLSKPGVDAKAIEIKYMHVLKTEDALDSIINTTVSFADKVASRVLDFVMSLIYDMIKLSKKSWAKFLSGKQSIVELSKKIDIGSVSENYSLSKSQLANFYYVESSYGIDTVLTDMILKPTYAKDTIDRIYAHTKRVVAAMPIDKIIDETPEDASGTYNHDRLMEFRRSVTSSLEQFTNGALFSKYIKSTINDQDENSKRVLTTHSGLGYYFKMDPKFGTIKMASKNIKLPDVNGYSIFLQSIIKDISELDPKTVVSNDFDAVKDIEDNLKKYLRAANNSKNLGKYGARVVMYNTNTITDFIYKLSLLKLRTITNLLIMARDDVKKKSK